MGVIEDTDDRVYAEGTYRAKNFLRRYAQIVRFKKSLSVFEDKNNFSLLDYGCGDGFFLNELEKKCHSSLVGYDPYKNPAYDNSVPIYKNWEKIEEFIHEEGAFDYITCLEVLEHMNVTLQNFTLARFNSILKPNGIILISVPIECGLPAFVKNLVRKIAKEKNDDLTWHNIRLALREKPIPEIRQAERLSHIGFYYSELEILFSNYFVIKHKSYSPFSFLGANFNSQVFYILGKKQ